MTRPFEGMQRTPYGGTEMLPAFVSFVSFCAGSKECLKEFKEDTGETMDCFLSVGINAAIDEATGRRFAVAARFADWVATNLWGLEGQAEMLQR